MKKKNILWSLATIVIAVITIWAVSAQSKNFSFDDFCNYVAEADDIWLIVAGAFMFGYILFECLALLIICNAFGYRKRLGQGLVYSAADIYFSAITPSASGGQPASAYFMIESGIPAAVSTLVLILNLALYTISIMIIGLVAIAVRPQLFWGFNVFSKFLIIIGYLALSLLMVMFVLLIKKESLLHSICDRLLIWCSKIRIIRNVESKRDRLNSMMVEYAKCAKMIDGHRDAVVRAFVCNFVQRFMQICVPVFLFKAIGGRNAGLIDIWATQAFTTIGSNCVPIPGAMGVSDYLLLDGLGNMMGPQAATNLELMSRGVSFYSCVLISLIIVLIGYINSYIHDKKR